MSKYQLTPEFILLPTEILRFITFQSVVTNMKILVTLGLIGLLSATMQNEVWAVPAISPTYTVTGVIKLPYAEIEEPFVAYYDEPNSKSRIDYYDGMVKTYQLGNLYVNGISLEIVPMTNDKVLNEITCFAVNGSDESPVTVQSVFPDFTGFTYSNDETFNDIPCEKWVKIEVDFGKYNKYSFWIAKSDGRPVHYQMKGYDYVFGSHFDKYEVDYLTYDPSPPDAIVFSSNLTCVDFPGPGASHVHLHNPMREFVNGEDNHVHQAFEEFKVAHGKSYSSNVEHQKRKSYFRQNMRFVHSTNRKGLGYTLKVNHFADRSKAELRAIKGRLHSKGYNGGLAFKKEKYTDTPPDTLDWRLRGAVTPVKDQAICGSCWSFGTTGTIEGSYFLKTGQLVKLSEQSLIDCSWGEANNGCDGGEDWRAFQWIMSHGGIPIDDSYGPYLGQDGYCHAANSTKVAEITGYVNITEGDEDALKLAIFNHGPISVSIDANHNEFLFYNNGVYYNPQCNNTIDGLDHSVLAVGYGTQDGEDYWLIKNSWSTYWGNDGYVLMSRRDNNCGVATAATYVNLA